MKSLILPLSVLAVATLAAGTTHWAVNRPEITDLPETVIIAPGPFSYQPAGTYRLYGKLVDPEPVVQTADQPLEVMKYQISRADYAACVADGACQPPETVRKADGAADDMPQTGVNWYDATAYATWFSRKTKQPWRLPTDAEWQRAAAERFDESEILPEAEDDPAQRWLAAYARNVAARDTSDTGPQPRGTFGQNSLGLVDVAGNVWEWTNTCVTNTVLGDDGVKPVRQQEYCGAHIAEGKHRAVIIDLVRNPKVGGCAAGLPADHVGFRLVRAR